MLLLIDLIMCFQYLSGLSSLPVCKDAAIARGLELQQQNHLTSEQSIVVSDTLSVLRKYNLIWQKVLGLSALT